MAYNLQLDLIANPHGKQATFFKDKKVKRSSERSPGPGEYEIHPHVLSKSKTWVS